MTDFSYLQDRCSDLEEFLEQKDAEAFAAEIKQLVQDIGTVSLELAAQDHGSADSSLSFGVAQELLFGKDGGGVLSSCLNRFWKLKQFDACIREIVNVVTAMCVSCGSQMLPFCPTLKERCSAIFFSPDSSSQLKADAAGALAEIFRVSHSSADVENQLELDEFIKKMQNLSLRLQKDSAFKGVGAKQGVYLLMGLLCELYQTRIDRLDCARDWCRILTNALQQQFAAANKKIEYSTVAGAFRGLCGYLHSYGDTHLNVDSLFGWVTQTLAETAYSRYDAPKAALELLTAHVGLFEKQLCVKYSKLYDGLKYWCGHSNREMRTFGLQALDAFLKQISRTLIDVFGGGVAEVSQVKCKEIFQFFMTHLKSELLQAASARDLSAVVKGLGYFAAIAKLIQGPGFVRTVLKDVLSRGEDVFLNPEESFDIKLVYLLNFLEAIPCIIHALDEIPSETELSLHSLHLLLLEHFPLLDKKFRFRCAKITLTIFMTCSSAALLHDDYCYNMVYQTLVRVFAHSPLEDSSADSPAQSLSQNEEAPESEAVAAFANRSGGMQVITCLDFLPLWLQLSRFMSAKDFGPSMMEHSSEDRKKAVETFYDNTVKAILQIMSKLDLQHQEGSDVMTILGLDRQPKKVAMHLFPVSPIRPCAPMILAIAKSADHLQIGPKNDTGHAERGIHVSKLKDHEILFSLEQFSRQYFTSVDEAYLLKWVYAFGSEIIGFCTRFPLVTSCFHLFSLCLRLIQKLNYFDQVDVSSATSTMSRDDKQIAPPSQSELCFRLFSKFIEEQIMHDIFQYQDSLLVSRLTVILTMPLQLVCFHFDQLSPLVKLAFSLGRSLPELANLTIETLEQWLAVFTESQCDSLLKAVLPSLRPYVGGAKAEDREQSRSLESTSKLSKANRRQRFSRTLAANAKKLKHAASSSSSSRSAVSEVETERIRRKVLMFLGRIGASKSVFLLDSLPTDRVTSWDMNKHLKFEIPFQDVTVPIYLDSFLPLLCDLATSSVDRQTKVVACELLHAVVIFIVGQSSMRTAEKLAQHPMEKLYRHLFPCLFELSCDVESVAQQLFASLVMQIIHWFTRETRVAQPESIALLDCLMDGLVDVSSSSALREFIAVCICEFFDWTIKHTQRSPTKVAKLADDLVRRIQSFAVHPNISYRIGAATAFNEIHRSFGKEEALVSRYTFDLLISFMDSLVLIGSDVQGQSLKSSCVKAVTHLQAIVMRNAETLNKENETRLLSRKWSATNIHGCVDWLLSCVGQSQADARLMFWQLLEHFVPLLPPVAGCAKSLKVFLLQKCRDAETARQTILTFEQAGSKEKPVSVHRMPLLFGVGVSGMDTFDSVCVWFDAVLAALDCYLKLALLCPEGLDLLLPSEKNLGHSKFFETLAFFIKHIARSGELSQILPTKEALLVRQEILLNRKKCNILASLLSFLRVVLQSKGSSGFQSVLIGKLWSKELLQMLLVNALSPASVGFDANDAKTQKCLEKELHDVFCALPNALDKQRNAQFLAWTETVLKSEYAVPNPSDLTLETIDRDCVRLIDLVNGLKLLISMKVLPIDRLIVSGISLEAVLGLALKSAGNRLCAVELKPCVVRALNSFISLALLTTAKVENVVDLLLDATPVFNLNQARPFSAKGRYIFATFAKSFSAFAVNRCDSLMGLAVSRIGAGKRDEVSHFILQLLDEIRQDTDKRRKFGAVVVSSILIHWKAIYASFVDATSKNGESMQILLDILLKAMLIDSSFISSQKHQASRDIFERVFDSYLRFVGGGIGDMQFKVKALGLLPGFALAPPADLRRLKDSLDELVLNRFPLSSVELAKESVEHSNCCRALRRMMNAILWSDSLVVFEVMLLLVCREEKHILEAEAVSTFQRFVQNLRKRPEQQVAVLNIFFNYVLPETCFYAAELRTKVMDMLVSLFEHFSNDVLSRFYCQHISKLMSLALTKDDVMNDAVGIISRIVACKLLALMYQFLPVDKIKGPISDQFLSELNLSATNAGEKEKMILVKLIELARKILASHATNASQVQIACAVYNVAAAAILATQTQVPIYDKVLTNESALSAIVDFAKSYNFPVEFDERPYQKKRFLELRRNLRNANASGLGVEASFSTVRYISSQYLAASSLSQDVTTNNFDFTTAERSSQEDEPTSLMSNGSQDAESSSRLKNADVFELEDDELNRHPCMETLLRVIKRMASISSSNNIPADKGRRAMPKWMTTLRDCFTAGGLNRQLLIGRLIVNLSTVFGEFAADWICPLINFIVSDECKKLGEGIHYFAVDLIVAMISWANIALPEDTPNDRLAVRDLIDYLLENTFHANKQVFRRNLQLLKAVVECWHSRISFSPELIWRQLPVTVNEKRVNVTGIQLLGVFLANKIDAHNFGSIKSSVSKEQFYGALVRNLDRTEKEAYAASAEVLGMTLSLLAEKKESFEPLVIATLDALSRILSGRKTSDFVTILNRIHRYFPPIVDSFLTKLIGDMPKLFGLAKNECMECIATRMAQVGAGKEKQIAEVSGEVKRLQLLGLMKTRDPKMQKLALTALRNVVRLLPTKDLLGFMPVMLDCGSSAFPECRRVAQEIAKILYGEFRETSDDDEGEILDDCKDVLLKALIDPDKNLRHDMIEFWCTACNLPKDDTPERLLLILRQMFSELTADSFLSYASYFLLQPAAAASKFRDAIFADDLAEASFKEFALNASWKQHLSSMRTPMLIAASQATARSQTADGGGIANAGLLALRQTLATESTQLSSRVATAPTSDWLAPSLGTFDPSQSMSSESFDVDEEDGGLQSSLLFRSARQGRGRWRLNPAKQRRKAEDSDETDANDEDGNVSSSQADLQLLRRRIVKDQKTSATAFFASRNIRRQRYREQRDKERQLSRSSKVNVFRTYRLGEIPDIKGITVQSIVTPLQALAQQNVQASRLLFESLVLGVAEQVTHRFDKRHGQKFFDRMKYAFEEMLSASASNVFRPLVASLLSLCYGNVSNFQVTADVCKMAALAAQHQSSGILLLEEYLATASTADDVPNSSNKKRLRLDDEAMTAENGSLWMDIASLYKSLDVFDAVVGIFSSKLTDRQPELLSALNAEALGDYESSKQFYEKVLAISKNANDASEEKNLVVEYRLKCLNELCDWKSLNKFVDSVTRGEEMSLWDAGLKQEKVLPYFLRTKLKIVATNAVGHEKCREELMRFVKTSLAPSASAEFRQLLESAYPDLLCFQHILNEQVPMARYYAELAFGAFVKNWTSSTSICNNKGHAQLLESLQTTVEMQLLLQLITKTASFDKPEILRFFDGLPEQSMTSLIPCLPARNDILVNRCAFANVLLSRSKPNVKAQIQPELAKKQSSWRLEYAANAAVQRNFSVAFAELESINPRLSADTSAKLRWTKLFCDISCAQSTHADPVASIPKLQASLAILDEFSVNFGLSRCADFLFARVYESLGTVCCLPSFAFTSLPESSQQELLRCVGLAKKFDNIELSSLLMMKAFDRYGKVVALPSEAISDVRPQADTPSADGADANYPIPDEEAMLAVANYGDSVLQAEQNRSLILQSNTRTKVASAFMHCLLAAMKLGSKDAVVRFPRLLTLTDSFPELVPTFCQKCEEIPCWRFLTWLPQLIALLDKKQSSIVQNIIWRIANEYPQAIIYPLKLSCASFKFDESPAAQNSKKFVQGLRDVVSRFTLVDKFTDALLQLNQPEAIVEDFVTDAKELLAQGRKDDVLSGLNDLISEVCPEAGRKKQVPNGAEAESVLEIGEYRFAWEKKHGKCVMEFNKIKSCIGSVDEVKALLSNLLRNLKDRTSEAEAIDKVPRTLSSYSPWLASFSCLKYSGDLLEIPGQYKGDCKPMPEHHTKIAGFSAKVSVMRSLRKPKVITIRGNDEREYVYMVKCGEDLRQDARIEQFFGQINELFARDVRCRQRRLSLKTYAVVPLTNRVGLIEFIPNVMALQDMLGLCWRENEEATADKVRDERLKSYVPSVKNKQGRDLGLPAAYQRSLAEINPSVAANGFRAIQAAYPADILKRGLVKLSLNVETLLDIRTNLISSHAAMCAVHYLLGIGDRHLGNSMIDMSSGGIIGIDFGYAFGVGLQLLPVPELVPFRLTQMFRHAFGPLGVEGPFKHCFIAALAACREHAALLLNILEVFVNEPSLDWQTNANKMSGAASDGEQQKSKPSDWYPKEKLEICKRKLHGDNPVSVSRDEVLAGPHKNLHQGVLAALYGFDTLKEINLAKLPTGARRLPEKALSCEDQAACLIDLATDARTLSRVWKGWSPWI